MSRFFHKLKKSLSSIAHPQPPPLPPQPQQIYVQQKRYPTLREQKIERVASTTRAILTSIMKRVLQQIYKEDERFKLIQNDPMQIYKVLQLIGNKVIEVQCLKICILLTKKIEHSAETISSSSGGALTIKTQVEWFQCILWYRKVKQSNELDDIFNFTCEFFKTDLTRRISSKSQLFVMHPILKYFGRYQILPLYQILFYLQPYVTFNIAKPTIDAIFQLNKQEIRNSVSLNQDNNFQIDELYPYQQQDSTIQYKEMSKPFIPPINVRAVTNAQNINNSNFNPLYPSESAGNLNFSNPIEPFNQGYSGNTFNLPGGFNSTFPYESPIPPLNYDTGYMLNQLNNPNQSQFNINQSQFNMGQPQYNQGFFQPQGTNQYNNNNFNQPQNNRSNLQQNYSNQNNANFDYNSPNINFTYGNPNFSPQNQKNIQQNTNFNKPNHQVINPKLPIVQTKKQEPVPIVNNQGLNILPQGNSKGGIQLQNALNINLDNKNEIQSFNGFEPQSYEKQQQIQRKSKEAEEAKRKEQEQQRRREEEQTLRKQQQTQRLQREQKEREETERQRLQNERVQRQKQELERLQREKERKQAQEREFAERERERREREEELRRELEEEQRERERESRMRERQREEEHELNVFVDNEREDIDRGFSGRFSSNMGFKFDFAEEEAEEFAQSKTEDLNNQLFRMKIQGSPVVEIKDFAQNDENQSIKIVEQSSISEHKPFKLFFFKHQQH